MAKSKTLKQRKLNPLVAIQRYCSECKEGMAEMVASCTTTGCPLYMYRSGKIPEGVPKLPTPEAAIREACIQCCGGIIEIETEGGDQLCTGLADGRKCPLWPHRMGRNPNRMK